MLAIRRLTTAAVRPLHTSATLARKAKVQEEVEDLGDDLFDDVQIASGSSERSVRRGQIVQNILSHNISRIGELRKAVQLSDSPEELEELGKVLRAWRVAGKRVTSQTAQELVGRCINLGRADLAQEYSSNVLQYGLPPLPPATAAKLQEKI